jgi:hypothetical protein
MNNNYLREKFVFQSYSKLQNFIVGLDLGKWMAGFFCNKDERPIIALYNPNQGAVVITRIYLDFDLPCESIEQALQDHAIVQSVYAMTVEPQSEYNRVMHTALDYILKIEDNG